MSTALAFKKATKEKAKGKVALIGPSGSGKTWTALQLARELAGPTGRIAVADSEHGTAAKYADSFEFDHLALESYEPENYIESLQLAARQGYDVVILDSLSHAWAGKGGLLEFVDQERKKSKSGNAFTDGWGKATPRHNRLIEALLACPIHLIVTMRSKTEYVIEKDEKTGKSTPRKVGMQPVQRDGLEYEFDVVGDMDNENTLTITKSRCPGLNGAVLEKPHKNLSEPLIAWLTSGVEPAKPKPAPPKPAPAPAPAPKPAAAPAPAPAPEPAPAAAEAPAPIDTAAAFVATDEDVAWLDTSAEYERVKPSQVQRLWMTAKDAWKTNPKDAEARLREIVERVARVQSTKDIPADLFDEILREITGEPAPSAE